MVEGLDKGGLIRREGRLTRVPTAWRSRDIDFGSGPMRAITIPWGDVSTAFHSTGIPNIEVYMAAPAKTRLGLTLLRPLAPLLGTRTVQAFLKRRIAARPAGPSPARRARSRTLLWGEATDDKGGRVVSRLQTPDSYSLTALTAVALLERVLTGQAVPGFQTPSRACGADFILGIEGVTREDL